MTTKKEIMQGVESVKARIVANNTIEYYRGNGDRVIRLHQTDIVTFNANPKGQCLQPISVTLNSGGWQTVTTKERMNRYLPPGISLCQEKSEWKIYRNGASWKDRKLLSLYYDGITIDEKTREVIKPKLVDKGADRIKKLISSYCKGLKELKELPKPSNGDCFYCLMAVADSGENLGESIGNKEHLLSHLEEKYYMGSLILNALRWAGYCDPTFIWSMDCRTSIVSAVRRYLKRQLGLPA